MRKKGAFVLLSYGDHSESAACGSFFRIWQNQAVNLTWIVCLTETTVILVQELFRKLRFLRAMCYQSGIHCQCREMHLWKCISFNQKEKNWYHTNIGTIHWLLPALCFVYLWLRKRLSIGKIRSTHGTAIISSIMFFIAMTSSSVSSL